MGATTVTPSFHVGDKVTTDFYPRERDRVREVLAVRPATIHCQSGWIVDATGVYNVDAGWFTLVQEASAAGGADPSVVHQRQGERQDRDGDRS